jgi:hypothetical protein
MKATLLTLLLPLLMSCINDDLNSCRKLLPGIKILVANIPGMDVVNPADIKEVNLYVFDVNKNLISTEKAVMNELVYLTYPKVGKHLYVVAIANTLSEQTLTIPKTGENVGVGTISLKKTSVLDGIQLYAPPDDLFRGELSINVEEKKTAPYELPLRRIVSSVSIKIKGLQDYLQTDSANFSALIGSPYNTVGFNGQLSMQTRAAASPVNTPARGKLNTESGVCELPATRILSSAEGENVSISIYHGTKPVYTATHDSEGNPLKAINGKLLEVWINFTGQVDVSIKSSPWGEETIWKEF